MGSELGGFLIEELLGEGGMGQVFRARQPALDRQVAIKILRPSLAGSVEEVRRFQREIQVMSQLTHPNVVRIFDSGTQGEVIWLAMELVRGTSIKQMLSRSGRLSLVRGVTFARDACRGLAAVHELGIVHRDLKPDNLMVTDGNVLKVMDFGLAKDPRATALTEAGAVLGTPGFLAPEMLVSQPCDHRLDIFQMAVVLYLMLTGELPHQAVDIWDYLRRVTTEPPDPPRRHNQAIPRQLETLILRSISVDPAQRPASMAELADRLDDILRELTLDGPSRAGSKQTATDPVAVGPARARPVVAAAVGAVLVLIAGVAGLLMSWQPSPRRPATSGSSLATGTPSDRPLVPGDELQPQLALVRKLLMAPLEAGRPAGGERAVSALVALIARVEGAAGSRATRTPETARQAAALAAQVVSAVEDAQEGAAFGRGSAASDDVLSGQQIRTSLLSLLDRPVPSAAGLPDRPAAIALASVLARGTPDEIARAVGLIQPIHDELAARSGPSTRTGELLELADASLVLARLQRGQGKVDRACGTLARGLRALPVAGQPGSALDRLRLRLTVPFLEMKMDLADYTGSETHERQAREAFLACREPLGPWLAALPSRRPGWREVLGAGALGSAMRPGIPATPR
ncbi:MAG: serine/threonine protein kinase [Candidatus Riflebacteria bacterium]|nr:serine/threonine protein kinase [Candidatus Riflebacteria bacterium]